MGTQLNKPPPARTIKHTPYNQEIFFLILQLHQIDFAHKNHYCAHLLKFTFCKSANEKRFSEIQNRNIKRKHEE